MQKSLGTIKGRQPIASHQCLRSAALKEVTNHLQRFSTCRATWGGFQGQVAGTGTWGGFNGVGTRDWDTGSVTWRDYWLISDRKADRLECVPACIYQCHYVRASVLQHVGTYECVHLCVYVSVSICSYSAMYLLCVCACHFSAFQAIHFPALEAIHFPALQANPGPVKTYPKDLLGPPC